MNCVTCEQQYTDGHLGQCLSCYSKKYHGPEYVAKIRAQRADRRAAGACPTCGEPMGKTTGFCQKHNDLMRVRVRRATQAAKDRVFQRYGGYVCSCCGETEPAFLSLDHIDGHPNKLKDRKLTNSSGLYYRIIRAGFPPDIRVLCMNCNWGRRFSPNGVCPHKLAATASPVIQ